MDQVIDVKGVKLLVTNVADVDMNGLRNLGDQIKEKLKDCVVVLVSAQGKDKVNLIVMVADTLVKKGVNAGNLIKKLSALVGGGGGGRPNMAQAGGKDPSAITELIKQAPVYLAEQIN